MGTPAARALDGAGGGGPAGGAPAGGAGGAPAGGGPAGGASGAGGGGAPGQGGAPGGGGGAQPFFASWDKPEQAEIRTWAQNKNFADTFILARTARDLEREAATLRQGKGYPVDKVDPATQQPVRDENAWKAWNALTGVPETADKYELPNPEGNPYPNFRVYMAEEMLKAGVPAAMAPNLAKGYERAIQRLIAEDNQRADSESELQLRELETEWGPQYKERMAYGARGRDWLYQQIFGNEKPTELQERQIELALGGTKKFSAIMSAFGRGNGEALFHGNDGGGGRPFEGGASAAQARISQIMADRSANRITDQQWREVYEKEVVELGKIVAAGMAPPPG